MVKRNQTFVRAKSPLGKWGNHDVLNLDETSFRAFVLDRMMKWEMVTSLKPEFVEGDEIEYVSTVEEKE